MPLSELIIVQSDPEVASGRARAVMTGGKTATIVPVSGTPVAPGVTMTMHPMLTGGPGIPSSYGENDVSPLMDTVAPCTVLATEPWTVAEIPPLIVASVPAS